MMNRRELFQSVGLALAADQLRGEPQGAAGEVATADWLKTCRALIC